MEIPISTLNGITTYISQLIAVEYKEGKITLIADIKEKNEDGFTKEGYEPRTVELTTELSGAIIALFS